MPGLSRERPGLQGEGAGGPGVPLRGVEPETAEPEGAELEGRFSGGPAPALPTRWASCDRGQQRTAAFPTKHRVSSVVPGAQTKTWGLPERLK